MVAPAIGTRNALKTKRGMDEYEIARTWRLRKAARVWDVYRCRSRAELDEEVNSVLNRRCMGPRGSTAFLLALRPYISKVGLVKEHLLPFTEE
jgi:hypothetical protein